MCDGLGEPSTVAEALGMLDRALDRLNAADAASLPAGVQAEALRVLERAGAKHTAARSRVLAAFAGQAGYEDDGQGSARAWLRWQTRVSAGAAAGAVGWVRRLAAHPVIAAALAAADLSESWARQVCAWTGRLPPARQDDADEILAAAAREGVDLAGLAGLAQEMYERAHRDDDAGDGFGERAVWLGTTLGGAGRLTGDLTGGCAAALAAVLEALGKRAGPEDIRSAAQRRHDALEEACRRLVASGMLPGRAGQPAQIQVHLSLAQLRGLPAASAAEAAWAAAKASGPGWLTGPDADAAACDATVVPIVTGHLDPAALDYLTDIYFATHPRWTATTTPGTGSETHCHASVPSGGQASMGTGEAQTAHRAKRAMGHTDGAEGTGAPPGRADDKTSSAGREPGTADSAGRAAKPGGCTCGTCGTCGRRRTEPLSPHTWQRLRRALLALATDALSGPGGLAAQLRAAASRTGPSRDPLASASLPLDIGPATETIPAHLRRAVTTRHPHCAFPGCAQPASVCEIHHIVPRSRGGPTSLDNLLTTCAFHHKIAVHRWGWTLRLNPDATTTATSPDGRTLHSHSPPRQAA